MFIMWEQQNIYIGIHVYGSLFPFQPGLTGKCASLYTVVDDIPSTTTTSGDILVTKVRDTNDCIEKPIFAVGILAGLGSTVPTMGTTVSDTFLHCS